MIKVSTSSGKQFLISNKDLKKVSKYTWKISIRGYVTSTTCSRKEGYNNLARYLLGITDPNIFVDHKNRNKLDNRRSNLRLCTKSENQMNRGKSSNSKSSNYKGVSFVSYYIAQIRANGKLIRIGTFETEKEAALAYNKTAKKLHGSFAVLNDIS